MTKKVDKIINFMKSNCSSISTSAKVSQNSEFSQLRINCEIDKVSSGTLQSLEMASAA
jgi:hypothetical protein